jgi:eukaryotic-like serine/threonine-protein kinase
VSIIASRYRVLRELGRGGMGVVYLVEHVHTGDHLALKVLLGGTSLDAGAVERFKREARASARIKSENVVKVVDADTAPELDGAPFLVMELLDGSDLQKRLEEHGRFSAADVLQYLSEAARALDKSHAIGIVHRDLKPENLFLHRREDGSSILKILDFGISKIVGGEAGSDMTGAGMTGTGAIMGTPLYMSPEQARGRVSDIGAATDVWAMGLIAIQLLAGEVYWQADTVPVLMVQILLEPLYPPTTRWPWLPPAIDGWFARSCAREPAQRFASVGEQMDALADALGLRRRPCAPAHAPEVHVAFAPTAYAGAAATVPDTFPAVTAPLTRVVGAHTTTRAVATEPTPVVGSARRSGKVALGVVAALLAVMGGGLALRARLHATEPRLAGAPPSGGTTAFVSSASSAVSPVPVADLEAGVAAVPVASASAPPVVASPAASARAGAGRRPVVPSVAPSATVVPLPEPKKPFAPSGL